jgi:NAD+ synthase (glutamine-hydrolysing)
MVNGSIVAQGSQFSMDDVEVVTATVDLEEVRAYRFAPSRNFQARQAPVYERIEVDFSLGHDDIDLLRAPTPPRAPRYHVPEEEIVCISQLAAASPSRRFVISFLLNQC